MKKISKCVVSLLLVVMIMFSTVSVGVFSASAANVETVETSSGAAAVIGKAVGKKALELGLRFACGAATALAERTENTTDNEAVSSIINYLILDGQGVTVNKILAMTEDILEEIEALETDLKNYTSQISSTIYKIYGDGVKEKYLAAWEKDVYGVITKNLLADVLNTYVNYFLAAAINAKGLPENEEKMKFINSYWDTNKFVGEPIDYTKENDIDGKNLAELKGKFENAIFCVLDSAQPQKAKDEVYKSAFVYNKFNDALNELVGNYLQSGTGNMAYSFVEYAATDAYYNLPFSHQQYGFINTNAKRQILMVTWLEMALNEYLSMQGEYLDSLPDSEDWQKEDWQNREFLSYKNNAGNVSYMSYNDCRSNYKDRLESDLEAAIALMESDFKIDTDAYSSDKEGENQIVVKCNLSQYMKPEDAVAVNMTIDNFESKHWYGEERLASDWYWMYGFTQMTSYSNSVKQPLRFVRVMSGSVNKEVYYVLDPSQYSSRSSIDFTTLEHTVKRNYVTDGGVGDLYIVSCDYYNIIKQMSDGVNTFAIPSSDDFNDEIKNLVNTPGFDGKNGYCIADFLYSYLPSTHFQSGSTDTRILTSTYKNNLTAGAPTAKKKGEITTVKANEATSNLKETVKDDVNLHDVKSGQYDYTAILANTGKDYKQPASLTVDNYKGVISNAQASYSGGSILPGESEILTPNDKITITFSVSNPESFGSLKMIRKNAEETETVLINGYDELQYFVNNDGTYTYEITMPYSEVEFVISAKYKMKATFTAVEESEKFNTATLSYPDGSISLGESADIKPNDKVTISFSLDQPKYFGQLKMITADGTQTVFIDNSEELKDFANGDGTYTFETTMPDSDAEFVISTTNYKIASVSENDPADVIKTIRVEYGDFQAVLGRNLEVPVGAEIVISFFIDKMYNFDSLIAVNTHTGETTTLLDVNNLGDYKLDKGINSIKTTMPDADTDFCVISRVADDDDFTYTSLEKDEQGRYMISTYDDLRTMEYYINLGYKSYRTADYVLVNDINVMNRILHPIGETVAQLGDDTPEAVFEGSFDGQNYTISNYKIVARNSVEFVSLFGFVDGEIKNLNLSGDFTISNQSSNSDVYVSDVAYILMDNAKVYNVSTNLNYIADDLTPISIITGIAFDISAGSLIENCLVADNINLPEHPVARYAGIFGDCTSNKTYTLTNCGNASIVTLPEYSTNSYGLVEGGTYSTYNFINCFDASNFTNSQSTAFIGTYNRTINMTNCYYLDTAETDSFNGTTFKTAEQFASGEVAYLLNSGVTDGTQVWYQNIDNGLTPDTYPNFDNNGKNTVYALKSNAGYTNLPENSNESVLNSSDLRTYQRIVKSDKTLSEKSVITYGYGIIDHSNREITVFMADTAERMGVLMHQGPAGQSGVLKLQGDYPKFEETSAELLEAGVEEPPIYVDGNGCIFITNPEDGSALPELTVEYTQKPVDEYTPTLYTLKVAIIDAEKFQKAGSLITGSFGSVHGGTVTGTLDKDDPDYGVIEDEKLYFAKNAESTADSAVTDKDVVDTGFAFVGVALLALAIVGGYMVVVLRKKRYNK